jgi:DMSO/TMAO reductase YedYZ molybdopterin-dependent catalytic subunit
MDRITRRQALKRLILAGGAMSTLDWAGVGQSSPSFWGEGSSLFREEAGRLLGTVPFADEAHPVMERVLGRELDGRLYTDLSALTPENAIIPAEKFYIRTCASHLLPEASTRQLRLRGLGQSAAALELNEAELRKMERDCGRHLLECAGNGAFAHFGMMSVAGWAGVPLAALLEKNGMVRPRQRILVSGYDTYGGKPLTSIPGASWIFSLDDLAATRAFLATSMNGAPLTRDHGLPIRLVVPGWYGCCCIKWVNDITAVSDDAAATSQMQEYAGRTHQGGVPTLARDYEPAVIDPAAMPVRVEKWLAEGKIEYRVIGIAWGAIPPAGGLEIQFHPQSPFVTVDQAPSNQEDGWSFWSQTWKPAKPGRYTIQLRLRDRTVRTRRLDMGFYARSVVIDEV